MVHARTVRFLQYSGLVTLMTCTGSLLIQPLIPAASAQTIAAQKVKPTAPSQPTSQPQPIAPTSPTTATPQNDSVLSLQGGQRLMEEANSAVSSQNYQTAAKKLQEARQVFNQLSNFYQELTVSFSGVDTRVAESQRQKALETAQMRDQATYQLALVHRAMNQPELSVPLLVQIVKSQQPTRELGKKAYQQLLELGFVDTAYPRSAEQPAPAQKSEK